MRVKQDASRGHHAPRTKLVTTILAIAVMITMTAGTSTSFAQSWKDLAKKAKDKIIQPSTAPVNAAPPTSTPSSSDSNPGAKRSPPSSYANTTEKIEEAAAAVPDSSGPLVWTYCFTTDSDHQRKNFVSDVFQIHGQIVGQSTPQYRGAYLLPKYVDPFKKMVDIKYGFPFLTQNNFGCEDGVESKQKEETRKKHYAAPPPGSNMQLVETGWRGANSEVLTSEETSDHATNKRDVDRLIAAEHEQFVPSCKQSNLLGQNLDCSCFAEHMSEARSRQNNSVEGTRLLPKSSELFASANLVGCTSREKLEAAANIKLKTYSFSPDKIQTLQSCVPGKVASLILAEPDALTNVRRYNGDWMKALTECSSGR